MLVDLRGNGGSLLTRLGALQPQIPGVPPQHPPASDLPLVTVGSLRIAGGPPPFAGLDAQGLATALQGLAESHAFTLFDVGN